MRSPNASYYSHFFSHHLAKNGTTIPPSAGRLLEVTRNQDSLLTSNSNYTKQNHTVTNRCQKNTDVLGNKTMKNNHHPWVCLSHSTMDNSIFLFTWIFLIFFYRNQCYLNSKKTGNNSDSFYLIFWINLWFFNHCSILNYILFYVNY